jgi:hypothetical protein
MAPSAPKSRGIVGLQGTKSAWPYRAISIRLLRLRASVQVDAI